MIGALTELVAERPRWVVLTGAGISTASGIPAYRDPEGRWTRRQPVTHQAFVSDEATRRRYWARSFLGWPHIRDAKPNAAHAAIARLERSGRAHTVITQNVDGLHQRAGSSAVIDLHGRLDGVVCLHCDARVARADYQVALEAANDGFTARAGIAPDGDADLEADFSSFCVPPCKACGGVVKPDVVFFGANVPTPRVQVGLAALAAADGLLVAGTSLQAYSGYRYCERARDAGLPIVAVNVGRTRADALLALKVEADCGAALAALADALDEAA